MLATLDRYEAGAGVEGPRFVRRSVRVHLTQTLRRDAWVYEHRGALLGCVRILHGDYRRHVEQGPVQ
jgi:hypothetical protein